MEAAGDILALSFNWIFKLIEDVRWLIIVALWFMGYIAKRSHRIKNNDIPLVLLSVSAILCGFAFWGDWKAAPMAIIFTGIAVMGNTLFRKTIKKYLGEDEDEEPPPTPEVKP